MTLLLTRRAARTASLNGTFSKQQASSSLLLYKRSSPSSSSSSSSIFQCHPFSSATSSPEQEEESESTGTEVFRKIVLSRHSTKNFDPRQDVPEATLATILGLTMRCPTSFNVQPFTITMVRSREAREKLAACMLGPNKARVMQAPATAVFAADLDPVKLVPRVQAIERKRGLPEAYLATLPFSVAFLAGQGHLAHAFKDMFTTAMSPLQPMPSVSSLEAWSFKNTAIAASWYMLAAAAHGLDTCPMEGFDGRRIQQALRIPTSRYAIPLVIATGHAAKRPQQGQEAGKQSPRFPPDTVIFKDTFGEAFKGIPVL